MFCENCGTKLAEGFKFCDNCGAPVPAEAPAAGPAAARPPESPARAAESAPTPTRPEPPAPVQSAPPVPVTTPVPAPVPPASPAGPFGAPARQGSRSAKPEGEDGKGKVPSVGEYLGMLILLAIPVLNAILLLVWAFGSGAPTYKRNYARALLWLMAISAFLFLFLMGFATLGS